MFASTPYDNTHIAHYKFVLHACDYYKQNYNQRSIAVASVDKTKHSHASRYTLTPHLKLYMYVKF